MRHFLHGRGVVKELRTQSCFVRFLKDGYTREIPYGKLTPSS